MVAIRPNYSLYVKFCLYVYIIKYVYIHVGYTPKQAFRNELQNLSSSKKILFKLVSNIFRSYPELSISKILYNFSLHTCTCTCTVMSRASARIPVLVSTAHVLAIQGALFR